MHQSLALLRWEAADLPPRHRSLHATLDWSYALLTPDQQALFRRLAVFAGGFALDGAEAVFTGDVPGADDGAGDGLFYRAPGAAAAPAGGAGRPGGAGRSQPRAAGRPGRGGAALPDAGDGARVRRWSSSRRAARRRRCGGGTWSTSWPWPSGFPSALGCRRRSGSLPGWTPSTTTCGRRWDGRRRAGRRRWGCGWRGRMVTYWTRPRPPARGPGLAGAGAGVGGADGRRRSGRGRWSGSAGWPASRATPTARRRRSARPCAPRPRRGRG